MPSQQIRQIDTELVYTPRAKARRNSRVTSLSKGERHWTQFEEIPLTDVDDTARVCTGTHIHSVSICLGNEMLLKTKLLPRNVLSMPVRRTANFAVALLLTTLSNGVILSCTNNATTEPAANTEHFVDQVFVEAYESPTSTPQPAPPTPAPTAPPTDTPEPISTNTPVPSATPSPIATQTSTSTPIATATATPGPTETPTPTATATTLPTATPQPTATATPEPTPTETATPQPTPIPGVLAILDLLVTESEDVVDGSVAVHLNVLVRNEGETDTSPATLVVTTEATDDLTASVPALAPGDNSNINLELHLPPGDHTLHVRVGESQRLVEVSVRVVDLALEVLEWTLMPEEFVVLDLAVTNYGNIDASQISLQASWVPVADDVGDFFGSPGSYTTVLPDSMLSIAEVSPVSVNLPIPSGGYELTLSVAAQERSVTNGDETATLTAEIEHTQLRTQFNYAEFVDYERDDSGRIVSIVNLGLTVENLGATAITDLALGAVCTGNQDQSCQASTIIAEIDPAEIVPFELSLKVLEGGAFSGNVYAGALEDTFRWGSNNVDQFSLALPAPPRELIAVRVLEYSVVGYWSDGTADVSVELQLVNKGSEPRNEPIEVAIGCSGQPDEPCLETIITSIEGGFGPTVSTVTMRLPMGTNSLQIAPSGFESVYANFTVPDKILGVERAIWECFSDVTPHHGTSDIEYGCATFGFHTIKKWDHHQPIKVWSTGPAEYVAVLDDALEYLEPILGVDFGTANRASEANILARVGLGERAYEARCPDWSLGCAGYEDPDEGRPITKATVTLRYRDDSGGDIENNPDLRASVLDTAIHELLHAMGMDGHPIVADSIMSYHQLFPNSRMSPWDLAIFGLLYHPAVKPGMTHDEVRELIVLSDELLDPPINVETVASDLLIKAYETLRSTSAVRFEADGGWASGCHDSYRAATVISGQFNLPASIGPRTSVNEYGEWSHYSRGSTEIYRITPPWTGFIRKGGDWKQLDEDFFDHAYAHTFVNPLNLMRRTLREAKPNDYRIKTSDGRYLSIETDFEHPGVYHRVRARFSVDAETASLVDFKADYFAYVGCSYRIAARSLEYDVDWEFPGPIIETVTADLLEDWPNQRALDALKLQPSMLYEVSGGWGECGNDFENADYRYGTFNRNGDIGPIRDYFGGHWQHFQDGAEQYLVLDYHSHLERKPRYFANLESDWVEVAYVDLLQGWMVDYTGPLDLLHAADGAQDPTVEFVDGNEVRLSIEASSQTAKRHWSNVNGEMHFSLINDFEVSAYQAIWELPPSRSITDTCTAYRVEAQNGRPDPDFELPRDLLELISVE